MSLGRRVSRLEADVFTCNRHGEVRLCSACDILDTDKISDELEAACQALSDELPDVKPLVGPRYGCPSCGAEMVCLSCAPDFTGSRFDTPEQSATRKALFALLEPYLRPVFVAKLRGEA